MGALAGFAVYLGDKDIHGFAFLVSGKVQDRLTQVFE